MSKISLRPRAASIAVTAIATVAVAAVNVLFGTGAAVAVGTLAVLGGVFLVSSWVLRMLTQMRTLLRNVDVRTRTTETRVQELEQSIAGVSSSLAAAARAGGVDAATVRGLVSRLENLQRAQDAVSVTVTQQAVQTDLALAALRRASVSALEEGENLR